MERVLIGCSGWNYKDWKGPFYPAKGCPTSRWLEYYAQQFPTVEINSTFYRLARPEAVARWLTQVPEDFVLAPKISRYVTHIKRLASTEAVVRFYEHIDPLVKSPKMGPVLWQLPERMHCDVDVLAGALDALGGWGRFEHCFEFRHPSWFVEPVFELLRWHGVALAIGDHPARPWQPWVRTTDWSFVRFHYGARGRRGNYSETELRALAERVVALSGGPVFAYFNNDWEGFAVRNALRLQKLLNSE
jgi:uncharacterized protein YecE (DUF72 family)